MIIGRDEQLHDISSHIEGRILHSDGPNVLFVTGEAGIGKTTLLAATAEECSRLTDAVVASAACSTPLAGQDIGEVEALAPWAEIMAALAADKQEARLETRRLVTELALAWVRVIPVVGDVLESVADTAQIVRGRGRRTESAPAVNAASQQQVFQQYINVLKKLAERSPLVLMLDDFHWADTSSANLLFAAARQLESEPVVFVIAYRPDDAASSREGEGHPIIHIRNELERYSLSIEVGVPRMTADDLDTLLRVRYTNYQNNDEFEEWLARISAGNALFITQFLDTLEDDGYIDPGTGAIHDGYRKASAPPSAYAVVSERLRRLSEETRELLRYASVEGDTFTTAVLAKITETPQLKLLQRLRLAEQVYHVVRSLGKQRVYASETTAYRFSHALLHLAMYDSLEQEERELLHEAILDVLKGEWQAAVETNAGNLPSLAARLAVHAGVLGEYLFAADVLVAGAEASWREYAEEETLRQLHEALAALDRIDGETTTASQLRARALMKRGEVHSLRGRYDAALSDFRSAHQLFERSGDGQRKFQAMNYAAVILGRQGLTEQSRSEAEGILAEARAADDARGQALALRTLGVLHYFAGEYDEALGLYQQSMAHEQSLGNGEGEADLLGNIGNIHYQRRRYGLALDHYRRSLALYESIGDSRGVARHLNNIGLLLDMNGDGDEALANFSRALATYRATGDRTTEAMVLNNIGNLHSHAESYDKALDQFHLSLDIYRDIGERGGEATTLYNIGNVLRLRGENDEALDLLRQSIDLFVAVGNRKGEVTARCDLGRLLLAMMRPGDATAELGKAQAIAHDCALAQLEAQSLLLLARCRLMLKEVEGAHDYLQQASELAEEHDLDDIRSQLREERAKLPTTVDTNDTSE